MDENQQPGGFLSPPTSSASSALYSHLPHPRTSPLRSGGSKESTLIRYVDQQILNVQRRFAKRTTPDASGEPVERGVWGVLRADGESEDESEEEEEEDEDVEEAGDEDMSGVQTSMTSASGFPSEIGGTESIGGEFTLRKQPRGTDTEEPGAPRSAYQVIPEQNIRAQGFFGGERAYDLRAAQQNIPVLGQENGSRKRKVGDVDVSVDVDALERDDRLSKDEIQRQFEAQRQAQAEGQWKGRVDQEDLSQMIAEESRKRLKQDQERNERRKTGSRR